MIFTDGNTSPSATVRISQELCHGYPIPDRRHENIVPFIILPAIAILIVILRCTSRLLIAKKLWWDDWAALFGLVCIFPNVVPC